MFLTKSRFFLLFCTAIFAVLSCRQAVAFSEADRRGEIVENRYINRVLGWTMTIPKGWERIDMNRAVGENGQTISEEIAHKVDTTQMLFILCLNKGETCTFQSALQPTKVPFGAEETANYSALKRMMRNDYLESGFTVDTSVTVPETIGGVVFQTFRLLVRDPANNLTLHQIMYNRIINRFDFGVTFTYTDSTHLEAIQRAFKASEFR